MDLNESESQMLGALAFHRVKSVDVTEDNSNRSKRRPRSSSAPSFQNVMNPYDGSLTRNLTVRLVDVYRKCNRDFRYTKSLNPRRALTKDCKPARNGGFDNASSDLVLVVNDLLRANHGMSYRVIEMVGQGSFGQVVKCELIGGSLEGISPDEYGCKAVAVKIVKNKPAYYNQALVERRVLQLLKREEQGRHIVRILDSFEFRNHLCLVFPLLSINLFELLEHNKFRGLPLAFVQSTVAQLVDALNVLSEVGVVHCDLKPENVLLEDFGSPKIQLIDFGSSCFRGQAIYSYIQSRFYRAPEVIVGLPYGASIDMWSLGCLAVELSVGLPIFPGVSQHNQLKRITETLGPIPDSMLDCARDSHKYYDSCGNKTPDLETGVPAQRWKLKSSEKWAREKNLEKAEITKRYIQYIALEDIVLKGHQSGSNKKGASNNTSRSDADLPAYLTRESLLDFCRGLLCLDPEQRWTAWQAMSHPFIIGESFGLPYQPPPDLMREDPVMAPETSSTKTPTSVGGSKAAINAEELLPTPQEEHDLLSNDVSSFIGPSFSASGLFMPYHGSLGSSLGASAPGTSADAVSANNLSASMSPQSPNTGGAATTAAAVASVAVKQLLSPPSRPDHPFPLAHQSSWDPSFPKGGQFVGGGSSFNSGGITHSTSGSSGASYSGGSSSAGSYTGGYHQQSAHRHNSAAAGNWKYTIGSCPPAPGYLVQHGPAWWWAGHLAHQNAQHMLPALSTPMPCSTYQETTGRSLHGSFSSSTSFSSATPRSLLNPSPSKNSPTSGGSNSTQPFHTIGSSTFPQQRSDDDLFCLSPTPTSAKSSSGEDAV